MEFSYSPAIEEEDVNKVIDKLYSIDVTEKNLCKMKFTCEGDIINKLFPTGRQEYCSSGGDTGCMFHAVGVRSVGGYYLFFRYNSHMYDDFYPPNITIEEKPRHEIDDDIEVFKRWIIKFINSFEMVPKNKVQDYLKDKYGYIEHIDDENEMMRPHYEDSVELCKHFGVILKNQILEY